MFFLDEQKLWNLERFFHENNSSLEADSVANYYSRNFAGRLLVEKAPENRVTVMTVITITFSCQIEGLKSSAKKRLRSSEVSPKTSKSIFRISLQYDSAIFGYLSERTV